jgi:hypothetical protein
MHDLGFGLKREPRHYSADGGRPRRTLFRAGQPKPAVAKRIAIWALSALVIVAVGLLLWRGR